MINDNKPSTSEHDTSPALWNPNAAANWSLLFTPIFGAFLHSENWKTLGEIERAKASKQWFYSGIAVLIFRQTIVFFIQNERSAGEISRSIGWLFLLYWYFSATREQAKYVKARYGNSYPRKPWTKPLLIATGCLIAFIASGLLISFLIKATSST